MIARRFCQSLAVGLLGLAVCGRAGEPNGQPQAAFNPLGGPAPSAQVQRAFALLVDGREADAYAAFQEAVAHDEADAIARFGLALHERLRGEPQRALEHLVKALQDGRSHPWAEVILDVADNVLAESRNPKPFLDAAVALEADPKLRPYLRDRVRHARAQWLLDTGNYAAARAAFEPLQYLDRWALAGPFDNRDGAGFETEYEPELEVDFAKVHQGRNRKVSWFHPQATPLTGMVRLSEIFEPSTHAVVFAVTHVQVEQAQWAVMRVGCAGAAKIWLNEREVLQLDEYNDYAAEKGAKPVYLQAGWNQVLVKSAVVEETEWAFGVRFSRPEGGPVPGLTVDSSAEALAAYKKSNVGRATPLLEPEEPDLGVVVQMREALKAQPDHALVRAFYGYQMDVRRLGRKEDRVSLHQYLKAVELHPKCPVFRLMLSYASDDANQARQHAETAAQDHPHLPAPAIRLAELASMASMEIAAERIARDAIARFGIERSGACPLYLAYALNQRQFNGEAYGLLKRYVAQSPYHAEGWTAMLDAAQTAREKRTVLEKALAHCGDDETLRREWAAQLTLMERDAEAAEFLDAGAAATPYRTYTWLDVARAYRRAGRSEKTREVLERARSIAPENPDLLAALGTEAFRTKDLERAETFWREALRIKPNSPEIKDLLSDITRGRGVDREFFAAYEVELKDLPQPKAEDYPNDHSVTLLNQEVVRVNSNGTSSRMIHRVAKLLRPEGLQGLSSHSIHYDPQRQMVDILRAAVITPQGRELSRASISDRTVSAAMGVQTLIYDEYHLKEISFRDLEPGALIDLQYTIRDTGDNIYGDYFADTFYLGDDQPVQRAEYLLDLPKTREFQMQAFRTQIQPQRVESKDTNREVFRWEAKDLPGLLQEQGMPPMLDHIPYVQVTTMKTWQEVSTWYWHLAKEQIVVSDEIRNAAREIAKDAPSKTEKLRAIHDWVIKKIRYLGIEFGRNGYKPHRSSETYKALYGDCKDTSTLITAMLKALDIDSRLVLIRTVDHGKVEHDALPAPNLFNHCIAYVPEVDGKDYWIDCTTDFHQLGEVPYSDQGAQVLVVGPDGGKFVQVPKAEPFENLSEQRVSAEVARDGSGTLFLRLVQRGQLAPAYRRLAETPGQLKRYLQEQGSRRFAGTTMNRLNHSSAHEPGPFWLEVEYRVPTLASQSGDRKSLAGTHDPLELASRYTFGATRTHDLNLNFPWARRTELEYRLAEGMRTVSLPEKAELKENFGTFTRTVSGEGATIQIRDEFVLLSRVISKEEYPKFVEFCRKIDALMQQKVLLELK